MNGFFEPEFPAMLITQNLQGKWERTTNPGFLAAEIKDNHIEWPDGVQHPYSVDGSTLYMSYDGDLFKAKYDRESISWSDGDIWKKLLWNKSQRRKNSDTDAKIAEMWSICDRNEDGVLSIQEFMTNFPDASMRLYQKGDTNLDGELDESEFRRLVLESDTTVEVLLAIIRETSEKVPTAGALEIPAPRDVEMGWGRFENVDTSKVLLRTHKYLQTKNQKDKTASAEPPLATLMGAEIFQGSSSAPSEIIGIAQSRFSYHISRDDSDRFYILINNRVTSKKTSVCGFWYFNAADLQKYSSFETLWWQFVYGTTDFKNSHFKCYPKVVKGSYMLKMMVPNVPTLLGQKVPLEYRSGKNYIEIDIESDNNYLASSITKVAYPIAKSLTIDQCYILQAEEESELPEIVFAGVRYSGIDLGKAIVINN